MSSEGRPGVYSGILLWASVLALSLYGLFFIYSTGYISDAYDIQENWKRQLVFIILGAVVALILCKWDYRVKSWRLFVKYGYVSSVLFLMLVLLFGETRGGAKRWLDVGVTVIQPAEFAKLFTLMYSALTLSEHQKWHIILLRLAVITGIPVALILMEPSYGNAVSIIPSISGMIAIRFFKAGSVKLCVVSLLLIVFLAAGLLLWVRSEREQPVKEYLAEHSEVSAGLRPYHIKRIQNFLDERGGWNERQVVLTIATGGFAGKGYLQGTMNRLGFLPRNVAPSDFIFSVICEEMGLLWGVIPVFLLYLVILHLGIHWAGAAEEMLGSLIATSVTLLLFTHISVNIAMSVRLLPIMGLPLPLLSYGGSYAISTFGALGMLFSVSRFRRKLEITEDTGTSTWSVSRLIKIRITRY